MLEAAFSFLTSLNRRYIFRGVPLVHALVFLFDMALFSKLAAGYNGYYKRRPVATMMVTNAILAGIADCVAQTLTAVSNRAARRPGGMRSDDIAALELQELDKKEPFQKIDLLPINPLLPPPYSFERTLRFAAYGFLIAPVQYKWFGLLGKVFPVPTNGAGATTAVLKRVAADQLVFAPISLSVFFTYITVTEGGGKRAVIKKLQDLYIPSLKANYLLWPLVQIINFRLMPLQFQLPFVSTIGIGWTAYLSLANASDDVSSA